MPYTAILFQIYADSPLDEEQEITYKFLTISPNRESAVDLVLSKIQEEEAKLSNDDDDHIDLKDAEIYVNNLGDNFTPDNLNAAIDVALTTQIEVLVHSEKTPVACMNEISAKHKQFELLYNQTETSSVICLRMDKREELKNSL